MEATEKNSHYNVCLMGASFETGNMGVSALTDSLIKTVLDIKPNAIIKLVIGNKIPKIVNYNINGKIIPIELINHRLSPKSKLNEHLIIILCLALLYRITKVKIIERRIKKFAPVLKALIDADFIGNIHGGDSFSDIYGMKKCFSEIIPDVICILLKQNFTLMPQTYGPFNGMLTSRIAKWIIKNANNVISRDIDSLKYLKCLVPEQASLKKYMFCPDVAFRLIKEKPRNLNRLIQINNIENLPVGININGLMYHGGYTRKNMFNLKIDYKKLCLKMIAKLLEVTDEHILLVPHTYGQIGSVNSDNEACAELMAILKPKAESRLHIIEEKLNQRHIKWLISRCKFFIGSRMHSCIAGLSQNIPTIGIAYSKKFKGVFESVDAGHMVLDARTMSEAEIIEKIHNAYLKVIDKNFEEVLKLDEVDKKITSTFKTILQN